MSYFLRVVDISRCSAHFSAYNMKTAWMACSSDFAVTHCIACGWESLFQMLYTDGAGWSSAIIFPYVQRILLENYYIVVPFSMFLFSISLPNLFMDNFRIYMFAISSPFLGNCLRNVRHFIRRRFVNHLCSLSGCKSVNFVIFRITPWTHIWYDGGRLDTIVSDRYFNDLWPRCPMYCTLWFSPQHLMVCMVYQYEIMIECSTQMLLKYPCIRDCGNSKHDHGLLCILIVPKGTESTAIYCIPLLT